MNMPRVESIFGSVHAVWTDKLFSFFLFLLLLLKVFHHLLVLLVVTDTKHSDVTVLQRGNYVQT